MNCKDSGVLDGPLVSVTEQNHRKTCTRVQKVAPSEVARIWVIGLCWALLRYCYPGGGWERFPAKLWPWWPREAKFETRGLGQAGPASARADLVKLHDFNFY